jgi:predicted PurR-regulated permease PerM
MTPTPRPMPADRIVLGAVAVAVLLLAALTLSPLWVPLAMAAWTAALLDPLAGWIARRAGGRRAVAAGACAALLLALLVPVGVVLGVIASRASAFIRQLAASPQARAALEGIVSSEGVANGESWSALARQSARRLPELAREHGAAAWRAAGDLAGAGASFALTVFVFFVALFAFVRDGRAMWAWARAHAPLRPEHAERLGRAFLETGRAILVGAGLTALAQGALATVIYAALGVPRFVILGALTTVCAFVPAVGTALVWGPVALGLALKGQLARAALLALLGGLGISSIDNVLRPLLQRWGGHSNLPAFVLLLAAFGGLSAFGIKGLLLGPLAIRLSVEVLAIARAAREQADSPREDRTIDA